MFFAAARQRKWTHRGCDASELGTRLLQHLHVNLVFKICGRHTDGPGNLNDFACFNQVATERFFANDAAEPRAVVTNCRGNLVHCFDAREVGAEDRDDVDVVCHVAN